MGIEMGQPLEVESVGEVGQVLAVVDGQDDALTLPSAELDRLGERLPAVSAADRGRESPAEPLGQAGEEAGAVGRARDQGRSPPRSAGLGQGPHQDRRLTEPGAGADHGPPLAGLDRIDQPRDRLLVRGQRDVRRRGSQERVARQFPVSFPHQARDSRAVPNGGRKIAFFPYDRYDDPRVFHLCRGEATVADRFFCPNPSRNGRIRLEGDESRHLSRVRRLGPGAVVEVFRGDGSATRAEVVEVGRDWVELTVVGGPLPDREPACRLTLATAVPKGERFDWLVEKATELGVDRLVPIVTERSVVDPRGAKLDRLRRLIVEAAKQCGRNRLMTLERPTPWPTWLTEPAGHGPRLLAHPGGLPPPDWPGIRRGGDVALAIGPEGGFTAAEVEAARGAGWQAVSLGATLLRIETAGLAGSAAILALCEGSDR
jgi:16S rRNA (uracil1498-N3)-methyltransferase